MINQGIFKGLYDVEVELKNGIKKSHLRAIVDNEQWKLGNVRLTSQNGESVLYVKSDLKKVTYKS